MSRDKKPRLTQIIVLVSGFCRCLLLPGGGYNLVSGFSFAEEIEYTTEDLPDPFSSAIPEPERELPEEKIPVYDEPVSLPGFTIQALVWGTPYPQAIINGNVLKIGDKIEGAKIINISKNGVEILYEGRIFSLPSPGSQILEKKEEK